MNVLLINPACPASFWSMRETIRIMGFKTLMPPLGLLTIAALLPREWELRLVDLNVRRLRDDDWTRADVVMISAMLVQRDGMLALIREAKRRGKTVVVGGPYPTSVPSEVLDAGCDFLVKGEAEELMPQLLAALRDDRGGVFECTRKPALSESPVPRFDLLELGAYNSLSIQTSRGCPFECEFCDVISLYGRAPRYKQPQQVLAELEAILSLGWRGEIFVADDNFIGNKSHTRALLNELIPWSRDHGEPFGYITQTSINLGQEPELMDLMTAANFGFVFVGVESPDAAVLTQAHKHQNLIQPLVASLRNINRNGLTVIGSFIIGFDHESPGAGGRIQALVEAADVPVVMLNLLRAPPNTALWNRLRQEGRLRDMVSDEMSETRMNFVPGRPEAEILSEYATAWESLCDPRRFYERARRCVLAMRPTRRALGAADRPSVSKPRARWKQELAVLLRLIWSAQRRLPGFWRLVLDVYRRNPSRLVRFFVLCGYGENLFPLSKQLSQQARAQLTGRNP
jgi:radical SAM superfamily enzyme YgiQ (UPF0313 family)